MNSEQLQEKLKNLNRIGYKEMTVAELIGQLAALPPMMEVYAADEDDVKYLIRIEVRETTPPYLLIITHHQPLLVDGVNEDYDAQVARKRQQAMDMAARSEKESKMPTMEQL